MAFERDMYYGLSGPDVFAMKTMLLEAGLYAPHIRRIAKESFGSDTLYAVCALQKRAGLTPNGVVNAATYAAILAAANAAGEKAELGENAAAGGETGGANAAVSEEGLLPANIGGEAAAAIGAELNKAEGKARAVALDALAFAFDPAVPRDFPISLYIRGGNLYNKDLTRNVITLARIASGAKSQPEFYDGGRREMMEAAVRRYPETTGADCSGGVVGLLRHNGCVAPGFDATADGFRASGKMRRIDASALRPGDLVHRSGHIGLYAGGGYVVEWMGGAYGCQLTRLNDRRSYSFLTGKTGKLSPWTSFLRPTYYEERT